VAVKQDAEVKRDNWYYRSEGRNISPSCRFWAQANRSGR